uniref:Putative vesicle coat complex copii subunit sec31 n=1 Tax=Panstrongylus megistus TaxID=65343 RepID=A0A069DVW3_9HEMI
MNRMRETTTTTISTTADHERNLDALLEDLQTTVLRSNSTMNLNGNATGYREMRRTYTDGTPEGTVSDYQIEYLNPANSTQHIVESSYNNMQNPNAQRSKSVTTTYKYNTVESTSGSGSSDMKLKQNISELDTLLDDLNTAQKKNFAESTTISSRNLSGTDPGILDQSGSRSLVRSEQKHYTEEKSLRGRSPSARRELVFTGQRSQDPSPMREQLYFEQHDQTPKVQQFYRYEKTTSTRTTGPTITEPIPAGDPNSLQGSTVRNYTYTDESPLPIRHRSPSPGGAVHSYHYSSNTTSRELPPPQSPPLDKYRTYPDEYPPTRQGNTAYNYSSTMRETRSDVRGKTPPPPHRSPSPVTFSQPPPPTRSTTVKTYTYDQQLGGTEAPHSPPPGQRFSPSDPSHNRLTYNVSPGPPPTPPQHHSTITNYKYSSTAHHHHHNQQPEETVPLMPRPFPTPQPTAVTPSLHSDQQPPKKLDELMASFSDADQRHNRYTETTVHHYTSNSTPHPPPQAIQLHPSNENEKLIGKEKEIQKEKEIEKVVARDESKNITGPPVYYPPGVELFAKKEESMMQQQSGGGRYRAKAKYEYEAKSKSKMTESSGKAVVPVCLPLCCAMPCVIM